MEGHPSTGRNLLRDSRELENGRCSSWRELKREGPPLFRYRPSEKEWNRLDDAKSRKRENGMPKSQSVCRVYRWKERESVPYGRRANNPVLFQVNAIQLTKINFFFLFSLHRGPFRASFYVYKRRSTFHGPRLCKLDRKLIRPATWLQHHHQRRRQARHRLPRSFQLIVPAGEEND